MSNQKILKDYLVGKNAYLKSDISNGKVIMLSGKWGSGKTHFWQNEIATDDLKKELHKKREVYSYISLYGKSKIEEIENDIFSQAYASSIGGENFITKGFSTSTKKMARFGSSKIANGLKEEQNDNIERIALSRLNNGGIICFDDFERKSKEIDLNDLFGFITQLTLNFNCKVVIILNDDVFEGEEKDIFSNVKEKTVSKFLKYEPSIKDLFDSIFDSDERYKILDKHKELILKTIEETEELNARIYIQVLDNLFEWIKNKRNCEDITLEWLILVNINFILNHNVFIKENNDNISVKGEEFLNKTMLSNIEIGKGYYKDRDIIKYSLSSVPPNDNYKEQKINLINNNKEIIRSKHFIKIRFGSYYQIESHVFQKINNFIETGILINE